MKKLRFLICLVICLCMLMASACFFGGNDDPLNSSPPEVKFEDDYDPNKEYNIRFFGWGDAEEQRIFKRVIERFEYDYPNIKVSYDATAAGSFMQALVGQINDLPDVFYLPDTEFLQWADSGRLLNFAGAIPDEELEQLWESALDRYYYNRSTHELGEKEGAGLYGLPKDLGPYTLVYNKDLVQSRIEITGSQDNEDVLALFSGQPVRWEVFIRALQALRSGLGPNDNPRGIPYYELEHAVFSNNADFFNEGATQSRIASPEFIAAIQFIRDLAANNIMPTSNTVSPYELFLAGNSMFTFMGPWDNATFWKQTIGGKPLSYDIIPVPYGPGPDGIYDTEDDGKSTAFIGSMSYSIANATKDRGTMGASIRLAKYLCMNEDAQREFYWLGQSIPNLKDMAYNEYIPDTEGVFVDTSGPTGLKRTNPANRQLFIDIAEGFKDESDKIGGRVRTLYYTYYTNWRVDLEDYLFMQGVWTGEVTPAQALTTYEPIFQLALEEMLADWKA